MPVPDPNFQFEAIRIFYGRLFYRLTKVNKAVEGLHSTHFDVFYSYFTNSSSSSARFPVLNFHETSPRFPVLRYHSCDNSVTVSGFILIEFYNNEKQITPS